LGKPLAERLFRPVLAAFARVLSKKDAKGKKGRNGRGRKQSLEQELRLAGIHLSESEFSVVRLVSLLGFMGLAALLATILRGGLQLLVLAVLFGMVLGVLVPRFTLKRRVKRRQTAIRQQLPDVMDLLSVSVEAGLGFDAALLRVLEWGEGPLIREMRTVYREIRMGRARKDALRSLDERCGVDEIASFTGSMIQAEQLGISIRNVLRAQSAQLRLSRKQRAEEKAMKAPVKMMIPLVAFIFPVLFIILLAPAVLDILEVLG